MSTTDSIVSSQTKESSWRKSDTTWTLGLFGTAIGAGVLFFPIRAGFGGLIPILLMLVLAYPIAFYCHRALARLCLSGSNPSGNITETVEEHFGKTGGVVITFLYFFAICPLLWIYGVTITNTFMTFWENQLQLPALNPYIPDDFTLIKSDKAYPHPELIVDEPTLRVVYAPSQYFASEPKADVSLVLRNPQAMDSARRQVMFALNDYLAGIALDQLSNQAAVGGISFSTGANNGLMVNANGYTQRLPQLFTALLDGYFSYTPTEEQLEQAKSWYAQMMDSADKGKAYDQAIMPIQMLSQVPYFERKTRRALLPSITLKEVINYRDNLKARGRPELLVIGNMSARQSTDLARQIQKQLGADGNEWCRNKDVLIDSKQLAIFEKAGSSTDSALAAVFAPPNVDEYSSMAASSLLGQIIQPWFYNQLRTEEQLGYAVFAFSMNVGRQWGMGFLLQSSDKQPAFLWQRFQAFFPTAEAKLRAMKPEEFAQIQQAAISQMLQAPQTLSEEASKLSKDFDRGNMRFDSRDKVVAQIKLLTPQKLADFFHQTVVDPQGMALLSQVSGSQNGKAEYAAPEGGKVWESVSALQKSLPLMRENE